MQAALESCHNLGKIGNVQFAAHCPLCRILKSCIPDLPTNSADELILAPAWTIERIEPSIGIWWKDSPGWKNEYGLINNLNLGKSLYVARKRPDALETLADGTQFASASIRGSVTFAHHAHNAIGICNLEPNAPIMSGRKIHAEIDFLTVRKWIQDCEKIHGETCSVSWTSELQAIRLIDVHTRRVVPYSGRVRYLCLSYVWGSVKQENASLGDLPPGLPATIEDAIKVVAKLGMRYLWVDSICIEQHNASHKEAQIALMGTIYRNSWATIVALSGDSAQSGLSRMQPRNSTTSQEIFTVDGTQFLSLLPTLQQQIDKSPWRKRAWTFQEGELSPRVLYFSDDQVYFECNSTQCCESICDASPRIEAWSNQRRLSAPRISSAQHMYTQGVFCLEDRHQRYTEPPYNSNTALLRYEECIREYTSRGLTYDADALNAVSALLQQVQHTYRNHFRSGFFWGLPEDDLVFALLWFRISPTNRRQGFPSWSWTGWTGPIDRVVITNKHADRPSSVQGIRGMPPEISGRGVNQTFFIVISKMDRGQLVPIYQANPTFDALLEQESWPSGERIQNSRYDTDSALLFRFLFPSSPNPRIASYLQLIYIETIIFRPKFSDFTCERSGDAPDEEHAYYVTAAGVTCLLTCNTPAAARILGEEAQKRQYLAVMHRDFESTGWFYEMLLLEWHDDIAYRVGPVKLQINNMETSKRRAFFAALQPARAKFALG